MGICGLRSPTYADEIRTPEGGFRLHDFVREPKLLNVADFLAAHVCKLVYKSNNYGL